MKKSILFILLLLSGFSAWAANYDFSAVAPSGQTLYYKIVSSNNRTVQVTYPGTSSSYWDSYTKPTGALTIPEEVSYYGYSYSVIGIDINAFHGCSGLTSVMILSSITSIGSNAFICTGLSELYIPNSVTSIGNAAFDGILMVSYCGNATGSPWGAFFVGCGCCISEHFLFADSAKTQLIKYLGMGGDVIIPNTVTKIGNSAFKNCEGLTSVFIPSSVVNIDDYAFYGCSELSSINIPNTVTNIGDCAFYGCCNLSNIILSSSISNIKSYTFFGCTNLSSIEIPNSVANIEQNAFKNCINLSHITIPNSVVSIGKEAFRNCSGLTCITIPNSVTDIEEYAFCGCNGLTSVTLSNSITDIKSHSFYGCSSITSIAVPSSVTNIEESAFHNCRSLTSISIPNTVTNIGRSAFGNCNGLVSVAIPNSVTSIGDNAFSGIDVISYCGSATGKPWGASIAGCGYCRIGVFVFSDSTKSHLIGYRGVGGNVYIPNSVTNIGNSAFKYCNSLTDVFIPSSVLSIEDNAFYGCTGLTSVSIPNSVTNIGKAAFKNCSSLNNVLIPNSVTSIGDSAFSNCSSLSGITIPYSVISIGCDAFLGIDVVSYCGNASGKPWGAIFSGCGYCKSGDFVFADSSKTLLLGYLGLDGDVSIPNSVIKIGDSAFKKCSILTSIIIPNSVQSIGQEAFSRCSGLSCVTFPSSVAVIGDSAFYSCSSLTSVDIPSSVSRICHGLFNACGNLRRVGIPNSVTSIGNRSFLGCKSLTNIEIPNSVTNIGEYAFCDCKSLNSVIVGDSIHTIGSTIFHGCINLTKITIGKSVADIEANAFNVGANGSSMTICAHCFTPPTIQENTFNPYNQYTVYVPCEALVKYQNAPIWCDYYIVEDCAMTITAIANDSVMGMVDIEGSNPVVLTAVPNQGYHFVRWNDGDTTNPRTVVIDSITQYSDFIAFFEDNEVGFCSLQPLPFVISADRADVTVRGAQHLSIKVYDSNGRLLATEPQAADIQTFRMPASGTYLVQIANYPAQRVVVIR